MFVKIVYLEANNIRLNIVRNIDYLYMGNHFLCSNQLYYH